MSLQSFDAVILSQDLHLAYSDGIEFCQPFGLRHPLAKSTSYQAERNFFIYSANCCPEWTASE